MTANADAVLAYLVDARQVVTCLPGAELTEAVDPRTFRSTMKVKVGGGRGRRHHALFSAHREAGSALGRNTSGPTPK